MNKFWKAKWIEALRGNEYKQAPGQLKGANGYCCLGVLCDIYGQKNNGRWTESLYSAFILNDKTSSGYIEYHLANRLGLNRKIQEKLSSMNDGLSGTASQTFDQIAEYIENYL